MNGKYSELSRLFKRYSDLPIIVYTSNVDGYFLEFNSKAADFFTLKYGEKSRKNIEEYYQNRAEREFIIRKASENTENLWLENIGLQFKFFSTNNDYQYKTFNSFCRPCYVSSKSGKKLVGFICLLYPTSQLEMFGALEPALPKGKFEIDINGTLTYCDEEVRNVLNIPKQNNSISVKEFFVDQNEYNKLREKLSSQSDTLCKNINVRLKKFGNPEHLILGCIDVIAKKEKRIDGNEIIDVVYKYQGVLRDKITDYLQTAPQGFYVVILTEIGNEIITWANDEFADIFGYDSPSELIGKKINEFHISEGKYEETLQILRAQFEVGKSLNDCLVQAKTKSNNIKDVILNAQAIRNENGDVIGRVGALTDISENTKRQLIAEFENRYGAFLHIYKSMLHDIVSSLSSIISAHGSDVVSGTRVDVDRSFKIIFATLNSLKFNLKKYFDKLVERNIVTTSFIEYVNNIIDSANGVLIDNGSFRHVNQKYKSDASSIRSSMITLRNNLQNFKKGVVAAEYWKPVQNDITEILRFARLVSLFQLLIQSKNMNMEIDVLHRVLHDRDTVNIGHEDFSISTEIDEAISHLVEFAESQNVTLRAMSNHLPDVKIFGVKRYFYTAIYNIVHNAIKYSWKNIMDAKKTTVDITIEEQPVTINFINHRQITINVINKGVPIHPREIASNMLFKFGYRGLFSDDRNRQGTGVGLWHSKKLIKDFNGDIQIKSRPISGDDQLDYKKPFLTTVSIIFNIKL